MQKKPRNGRWSYLNARALSIVFFILFGKLPIGVVSGNGQVDVVVFLIRRAYIELLSTQKARKYIGQEESDGRGEKIYEIIHYVDHGGQSYLDDLTFYIAKTGYTAFSNSGMSLNQTESCWYSVIDLILFKSISLTQLISLVSGPCQAAGGLVPYH